MKTYLAALAAASFLAAGPPAAAGVILQPKAVTVNIGGEVLNFPAINMINQSGLSTTYADGVTDFDTYVALKPLHSISAGEWLSNGPIGMARVTFDLGAVFDFNGIAFWNEDSSSISAIIGSVPVGGGFSGFGMNDTIDSVGKAYGPSVFRHQVITSRYVTMDIYGCNRAGFTHNGCGLGEVAFRSASIEAPPPGAVPEPATWAMLILGFGVVGATMRSRRRAYA